MQPGGTNLKPIIEVEPQPDNKFLRGSATPPGGEIPPIGTPPIGIAPPIELRPAVRLRLLNAAEWCDSSYCRATKRRGCTASWGGATPPGVMPKFPSGTPGVPTTGAPIIPGVPGALRGH